MTVKDFQDFCWNTDGIRVLIHAALDTPVDGFTRKNAVNRLKTVSDYRNDIQSVIGSYAFSIVDGKGKFPNGNTKIETVRETYA